jgi:hypothetical protein
MAVLCEPYGIGPGKRVTVRGPYEIEAAGPGRGEDES